jgi:hypothetical protein
VKVPAVKKKNREIAEQVNKKAMRVQSLLFSGEGFWRKNSCPALVLFLLGLLLYGYTVTFDYVLDDKIVLSENSFVKKGVVGVWDILTTDSFEGYFGRQQDLVAGGRYRPLSLVTFAIEYQFFGLRPSVSHFFNVLLYALTGLLLFRVLCLLFSEREDSPWFLRLPFVA